jgi:hypothetical protein
MGKELHKEEHIHEKNVKILVLRGPRRGGADTTEQNVPWKQVKLLPQ